MVTPPLLSGDGKVSLGKAELASKLEQIAAAHEELAAGLAGAPRVANVGRAWAAAQAELPDVALYADDQEHPSPAGTALLPAAARAPSHCAVSARTLPSMDAPRKAYTRDDDGKYQVDDDKVAFLLMDREQARLDKDYKTADSLREQIEELGVKINDKARTWAAGPLVRLYTRPKPCDRVVMRPPCVIVCQAGGEGHRC